MKQINLPVLLLIEIVLAKDVPLGNGLMKVVPSLLLQDFDHSQDQFGFLNYQNLKDIVEG
jgi:hypothetical protein